MRRLKYYVASSLNGVLVMRYVVQNRSARLRRGRRRIQRDGGREAAGSVPGRPTRGAEA
ncbi:MAG TPA: hypothetical protein VFD71_13710 [Planctomycetota bacterium]|nr:hypothetical protein [Planctomycetota bacterium]